MLCTGHGRSDCFGDRRLFVKAGSGLLLSSYLWTPEFTAAAGEKKLDRGPAKARTCILVYLLGGPPHLDMWDLKPSAPAEIRGPFRPRPTAVTGLQICEHLPKLAQLAPHYALVRSISHNNHNHTPMIYYTLTGKQVEQPNLDNDIRPPQRSDAPHLGSVVARSCSAVDGLPGYVAIPELAIRSSTEGEFKRVRTALRGGSAGFLGPLFDPLTVNGDPGTPDAVPMLSPAKDVTNERLERRAALLSAIEQRGPVSPQGRAREELTRQAVLLTGSTRGRNSAFLVASEPEQTRDRYGRHRFGRAMLLARRLAEAGVPFVGIHFNEMTVCDGWDTHSKNFPALQNELLPMLDQSLSALLLDLQQRGRLEQTLVIVMGEFGRTPRINKDAGRDHWGLCQSVLLAGGGIQGGRVLGSSDRIGAYPSSEPIDPVDLHATMYHLMGIDPGTSIQDNLGRPSPVCTGNPITGLL